VAIVDHHSLPVAVTIPTESQREVTLMRLGFDVQMIETLCILLDAVLR
jgi:hypothetical protein